MQGWAEVVANPLMEVWSGFAAFVPTLVGAIVILVVGLIQKGLQTKRKI